MRRQFLIVPIAMLLACASTAAVAANDSNTDTYKAMDKNNDGQVSQTEFGHYYKSTGVFAMWDVNQDGWMDEGEFRQGLYSYYDDNNDGYISDAEWEDGVMVDDYGDNGYWDN